MNRIQDILAHTLIVGLTAVSMPALHGQVTLVNMVPQSRSGETNQDSEPTIAVNPSNKSQLIGSAFTWDNLTGGPMTGNAAPVYVSTDGGQNWSLVYSVPSTIGAQFPTGDITMRFSGTTVGTTNTLYTGILHSPDFSMRVYRAADYRLNTPMNQLDSRTNNVDQPHVNAATDTGKDRVYVGFNNGWGGVAPRTATLDFSVDAGIAVPVFNLNLLEVRSTGTSGQDGFAIIPAIHPSGVVYAAFFGWRSGGLMDIVVMRDDNWGTGPPASAFHNLSDSGDLQFGQRVVTGRTIPSGNIGQQRVGSSSLSLVVDPRDRARVYIAWLDLVGGIPTLHVRRSLDSGQTWSATDMLAVSNAVNPGLAINSVGKVGFLYQQLTGTSRWETHFVRTTDSDATVWDSPGLTLANTSASTPVRTFSPYIGDYDHVVAVGRNFYGIFSASNYPDTANYYPGVQYQRYVNWAAHKLYSDAAMTVEVAPSIDPFFFHVMEGPQIQAPTSIAFPVTCAGATSQVTLTICNTGAADLHVNGITSSNPQFAVLAPSGGYPVTIAPGSCFPFQATFSPTGSGPQSATLTVTSDDPVNPTVTIAASGTAGAPAIATLIANTGDFGEVCPGSFRDLPLTINNNGLCSLVVTGISSSSLNFKTATVVAFPLTVAPGTSLQVPIRFEPSGPPGPKAGNLTVTSNDPVKPSAVVPVHGVEGQPVIATVVADSGDFGSVCVGRFKDLMVTIANSGSCPLKITNIASSSPEFKVAQVLLYPLTVAPGGSIQVPIRYEPTSPGDKTATITVTSDDPASPSKVVNVKATTPPEYICHPPTFAVVGADIGPAFGPARAGDYSFSGYGRVLAPFGVRKTYGVQAQGEYMYEQRRQEGQFDGGLLSRHGPFQVGAFGSFKYVQFNGFQSGTSLGQAAFTADFLFLHLARFGAFGTLEFRDGNIVSTPSLTPSRVRVMNQLGASGQVQLPLHNYLEGNAEWLHRSMLDRPGATLRIVHQWHNIGFFVEGDYNETFVDQHGSGRVVFGAQFGHWPRPHDLEDKRNPLGTDVPRIHYRVVP